MFIAVIVVIGILFCLGLLAIMFLLGVRVHDKKRMKEMYGEPDRDIK